MLGTAVQLMYEVGDTAVVRGTGTFFRFLDRLFLVTASHLFDGEVDPNRKGVPIRPFGPETKALGPARLYLTGEHIFGKRPVITALTSSLAFSVVALRQLGR